MEQNLTIVFESEYFSGSKTFQAGPKQDKQVLDFLKIIKKNHDDRYKRHQQKLLKVTIEKT